MNKEEIEVHGDQYSHTTNLELTSEIVSAYVSNHPIPAVELPKLIESVFSKLVALAGSAKGTASGTNLKPAVPVKSSVKRDYIICLEDGKKFKTLKRHLRSEYDMSPEQYRQKWRLPADYPMVAPGYAEKRSQLARSLGLGRKPGAKIKKRSKQD